MYLTTLWLSHCPVSIVQEAAGGGAAAEDIISPSHPKPIPWALQSSKLPCPQSWLPTSWRTLHWKLRKSKPTLKKLSRNFDFSGIKRKKHLRKKFNFSQQCSCGFNISFCNIIWCGCIGYKTVFIRDGRPCKMLIPFGKQDMRHQLILIYFYVDNWDMCDLSHLFWGMQD